MPYTIDDRRIAHQTVDGEVIAIDFVNGAYYSMRGTACEIWQMLILSVTVDAIVAAYRTEDPAASEAVDLEIRSFVAELLAVDLLGPGDPDAPAQARPPLLAIQRQPYATPRLEKFEDMADLIKLDPVHDVSDVGWPHVPKRG
ncbi:MAG: PqqD family protein [Acidobacteriota bacterium]